MASGEDGRAFAGVDHQRKTDPLTADAQGHGVVREASAEIDEYADVWTFMLWQLGGSGFQPT